MSLSDLKDFLGDWDHEDWAEEIDKLQKENKRIRAKLAEIKKVLELPGPKWNMINKIREIVGDE